MIQRYVSIQPCRKKVVAGRELEFFDLVGSQIIRNLFPSGREPNKYAEVPDESTDGFRQANCKM